MSASAWLPVPPSGSRAPGSSGRPAAVRVAFVAEARGDPLGPFPSLVRDGRPYNAWLTERILEVVLARWLSPAAADRSAVAGDVERACADALRAFREILPAVVGLGDPALLAALGVTVNLLRTLALVGEFLRDGGRPDAGPPAEEGARFRLSRLWCGMIEYPDPSPYFVGRIHPPTGAGRLDPRRRDPGHLTNALWCSPTAVSVRCDEAIAMLRGEIRRSGLFTPDDLRHLRGHPLPVRTRAANP